MFFFLTLTTLAPTTLGHTTGDQWRCTSSSDTAYSLQWKHHCTGLFGRGTGRGAARGYSVPPNWVLVSVSTAPNALALGYTIAYNSAIACADFA
jgi:hypothetical protein